MITLREITPEQVVTLLTDDDIWDSVSEDGQDKDDFAGDGPGLPLGAFHNGDLIGMFLLQQDNSITLTVHIAILKQHRNKVVAAVGVFMDLFMGTKFLKLNAEIPAYNDKAIKLAKHFGFTEEGTNIKSIMKNGKLIDQVRLGITKEQAIICHQH